MVAGNSSKLFYPIDLNAPLKLGFPQQKGVQFLKDVALSCFIP